MKFPPVIFAAFAISVATIFAMTGASFYYPEMSWIQIVILALGFIALTVVVVSKRNAFGPRG